MGGFSELFLLKLEDSNTKDTYIAGMIVVAEHARGWYGLRMVDFFCEVTVTSITLLHATGIKVSRTPNESLRA